jgi:hypothetical protein
VPRRLRAVLFGAGAIAGAALAIGVVCVGVGALIAAIGGHTYNVTIASVLFIVGGVVFVWNGISGGSARGRLADLSAPLYFGGMTKPLLPTDSLGWVAVGLLVIGGGVVAAIL